jgi:hypothetical protein
MDVKGHFKVERIGGGTYGAIRSLRCNYCNWGIAVDSVRQYGDKSGLGKYNRAKGHLVRHLHTEHFDKLAKKA